MFDDVICFVGEVAIGAILAVTLMLSYTIARYNDVSFPDDIFIMEEAEVEVEPSIMDGMTMAVLPGE